MMMLIKRSRGGNHGKRETLVAPISVYKLCKRLLGYQDNFYFLPSNPSGIKKGDIVMDFTFSKKV
jgi:hypothetical protein